jgi:hypothetical protein
VRDTDDAGTQTPGSDKETDEEESQGTQDGQESQDLFEDTQSLFKRKENCQFFIFLAF